MTRATGGTYTRGALSPRPRRSAPSESPGAPLGLTVALTVTLGVACFAVVLTVTLLLVAPKPVPGLAPLLTERQDAESTLYLLAFGLILPLALLVVPRLADAIAAGSNGRGLSLVAAVLIASLMLSLLVARALPGESAADALGMLALWWLGALAVLVRAGRARPWEALLRAAPLAFSAWALAAALVLAALLAFTSLDSISLFPLVLGVGAILAVLAAYARIRGRGVPKLSHRWGLAIDAAIILVLAFAIPDLVIFKPVGAGGVGPDAFNASVIQFHQDFLLGPANQVLAGDAVLVHTSSQYGVAPIYLLATWFQLVPIGYGTLGFLDGILYVLLFASGYCVLRIAGTSRVVASGALVLAVVALLYNLVYPVGGLLQHGPLRFGLPMAVIVAATASARWPRQERAATVVQLLVVGLSAIWALETFAYTLGTFIALASLQAYARAASGRLRWLVRRLAAAVAACVGAQLLFAGATLALAGHLPDWGQYFAYLDALLLGKLADITYDFAAWSPGLPVGVAYAASAVAVVLVAVRKRDLVTRERAAFVALAGTTAYGSLLFTYFVNRSSTHILPYVSFPAVLIGALWLALLLRGSLTEARRARLGGLAFGLSVALVAVAVAWSAIGTRFSDTPLAYAVPGGTSLSSGFHRLWHPPPINPRSPAGERLVDRYMPGERRILILASSNLGSAIATEILTRSGRANELPFGDPVEDSFASSPDPAAIASAVDAIQPGDRLLMPESGFSVLAELRRQPSRDAREDPVPVPAPDSLTPQQESVLQHIGERFRLHVIAREEGLVVASLKPR
jgi:hypothetical protein